jgi:hypothetical protein
MGVQPFLLRANAPEALERSSSVQIMIGETPTDQGRDLNILDCFLLQVVLNRGAVAAAKSTATRQLVLDIGMQRYQHWALLGVVEAKIFARRRRPTSSSRSTKAGSV